MSVNASTLRRLASLNLPQEAMAEVLSIIADMQAVDDARKEKDRERKRKVRGQSMENDWKVRGQSMENDWNIHGKSEDKSDGDDGVIYNTRAHALIPVGLSNDSPPLNKTLSSLSLASLAERFYSVCPKKIGPDAAKRKFISLAKAGKDPEAIIAAMEAWSEAWRLAGTEKQFIPAPTVWLNRGDYASTDYPTPSKSNVALFTPSNAPRKFRIDRDSKQGKAWEAHMASLGKRIPWANSAWYFDSEWPPPDAPIPFTEAAE